MKEQKWHEVKAHFDVVHQAFIELRKTEGPLVAMALPLFIEPLARRYEAGERTQELYDEMLDTKA